LRRNFKPVIKVVNTSSWLKRALTFRKMFESQFDERTAANMEIALQHACQRLPADKQDRGTRKFIAERLIDAARQGHTTLTELTAAGMQALHQLG
jgi:hypothetical protein